MKAILFDLDDTLLWDEKSIEIAFNETCQLAESVYGLNPKQLEETARITARKLYAAYDTYDFTRRIGINPFEGLWGTFSDKGSEFQQLSKIAPIYQKEVWKQSLQELGVEDESFSEELAKTFPKKRRENPVVFKETMEVLEQLKNEYSLLLLTNGSPSLQTTKLALTPKLKSYFNQIVISGDFGVGKPDPAIFEYALKLLSVDKDEVMMVGDNLHTDILGANRTGITSIWINRKQKQMKQIQPSYEIKNLKDLFAIL